MTTKKSPVKVKATVKRANSPVKDFYEPPILSVATKIVADDPMFIPKYQTPGSACADLVANIPVNEFLNNERKIALTHRSTLLVDCGFSMELPPGYKACIAARSSLASKGLVVANAPAQIDSDYRGRVKIIVTNIGKEILTISHGDRIGQIYLERVTLFDWVVSSALGETERGVGGFGSTGK